MKDKTILSAGVYLVFLIGIGKLIAFGKDIIVSSYYGATYETDAFFVANNVPSFIFVGFYSTVSLVFLPLYNKINKTKGQSTSSIFASNVVNIYAFIAFLFSVIGILFATNLIVLMAPSLDERTMILAIKLTRITCLSFVFSITAGILSTIQYVNRLYTGPQLIPILNNLIVIIAIILFAKQYGIYVIAISGFLGWVIQVPLQKIMTGKKFSYSFIFNINDESIKKMSLLIAPAFIGISIDQINILIDNILGSGLIEGSLSALNYGMRLMNFFSGLFVVIITSIIYPIFSDHIVNKDTSALNQSLNQSIRTFALIASPTTVLALIYNYEIVSLVFKRGAFTELAAVITSEVFWCYSVGILFILLREIFNKVFYAFQDAKTPLYISIFAIIINIVMSIILVDKIGVSGLALATSISIICYVFVQVFLIKKRIGSAFYQKLFPFLTKVAISLGGMTFSILLLNQMAISENLFINFVLGCFVGLIFYIIILFFFKVKELNMLWNIFHSYINK